MWVGSFPGSGWLPAGGALVGCWVGRAPQQAGELGEQATGLVERYR